MSLMSLAVASTVAFDTFDFVIKLFLASTAFWRLGDCSGCDACSGLVVVVGGHRCHRVSGLNVVVLLLFGVDYRRSLWLPLPLFVVVVVGSLAYCTPQQTLFWRGVAVVVVVVISYLAIASSVGGNDWG